MAHSEIVYIQGDCSIMQYILWYPSSARILFETCLLLWGQWIKICYELWFPKANTI